MHLYSSPYLHPERDSEMAKERLELRAEGAVRLGVNQHSGRRDVALHDCRPPFF